MFFYQQDQPESILASRESARMYFSIERISQNPKFSARFGCFFAPLNQKNAFFCQAGEKNVQTEKKVQEMLNKKNQTKKIIEFFLTKL